MSKASLRQAVRLLTLVEEAGWGSREVNKYLIEQWGSLRNVAVAMALDPVFADRIATQLLRAGLRISQARVLYDKGWGEAVGVKCFEEYLDSVPSIPEWPVTWNERFGRVVLVDPRVGVGEACQRAQLVYAGDEETFINEGRVSQLSTGPYWMNCQVGRQSPGHSFSIYRQSLPKDEVGLVAIEGVASYVQDPQVINGHFIDLPGSILAEKPLGVACLGLWREKPELSWHRNVIGYPNFGQASRGVLPEEKK